MKRQAAVTLGLLSAILFFAIVNGEAAGFIWEPASSSYHPPGVKGASFYALNALVVAQAGLETGVGYGTIDPNGAGNPYTGTTAFGGPAPYNLASLGINERLGHYYFGFANTYPTSSNFNAYELGNTVIQPGTELNLVFKKTTDDPINFIGICGGTDVTKIKIAPMPIISDEHFMLTVFTTDPVYSTQGGADQDSVFGMYINYGSYDDENVGVNYDGAIFSTDIHWWDIDVPAIPKDKLASIKLSTQSGTEASVGALIPNSYFNRIGLDPDSVNGYVDETKLPLGQGSGETHSFEKINLEFTDSDFTLDGTYDEASAYLIRNDQWSEHDIGVGEVVPEPASAMLILFGSGIAFLINRWTRR